MQIGKYELHPACVLLPPLAPEEFAELRASIEQLGLIDPITRYAPDGSILDGRNRLQVCLELGIEPKFEVISPPNPWLWVWHRNIKRRHLEPGRRALLRLEFDASMRVMIEEAERAAAERKVRGLKRSATRPTEPPEDQGEVFHEVAFPHDATAGEAREADALEAWEMQREAEQGRNGLADTARELLATAEGVSKKTAGKALKLFKERPDLVAKVIATELTLEQADRERRRGGTEAAWKEFEAYYSPAWTVEQLLGTGLLPRPRLAVEPCVGDGAIVRALGGFCRKWFTMDIRDVEPAHDGTHITGSWLEAAKTLSRRQRQELAKADLLITNSAFSISQQVVEVAWELCPNAQIWILQRRTWHDAARAAWFADHQPDEINLSPRIRFIWPNGKPVGNGTDNSIHTWFGFGRGADQPCFGPNGGITRTLIWPGVAEEDAES